MNILKRYGLIMAAEITILALLFFALGILAELVGLAWALVVAGLIFAAYALYGTQHPDIAVEIDPYYLTGLQNREGAIRRLRIGGWLLLIASIAWITYWLVVGLS